MKICLAQAYPVKGNLTQNLSEHLWMIRRAATSGSDLIVFPELSLTGYEPALAKELSRTPDDSVFDPLQKIADACSVVVAAGMPLKMPDGIVIGMLILCPNLPRSVYAKQILHADELPYFVAGKKQVMIDIKKHKIAFGICYESLQRDHFLKVSEAGATVYLASVAKPERGIKKAALYFAKTAAEFSIPILMVNSVGHCDDFMAAGQSGCWNEQGEMLSSLDRHRPGMLLIDLETNTAETFYFENEK